METSMQYKADIRRIFGDGSSEGQKKDSGVYTGACCRERAIDEGMWEARRESGTHVLLALLRMHR
jgi:hypothetical protein